MKKNKILLLTSDLDVTNGWGRYSFEIFNRISKLPDFEVEVLVQKASGQVKEFVILPKVNDSFFKYLLSIFKIRKFVRRADIIHCLDGWPYGVIASLANIGLGKRLIINGVGTYSVAPLYLPIKKNFLIFAYKKAYKILSISRFTQSEIKKVIDPGNLAVVHLGVNSEKFNFKPVLASLNAKKIILSVGALKKRKGYHVSISALAQVKKEFPNLIYYIVGDQSDDKYFSDLKELVKKYDLDDQMKFLENVSDQALVDLYHQANLFALTSVNVNHNFEGFGLVFLEAGACGKPVIGTLGCGAEDAIINGYNGLLIKQNDPTATAQAMIKILSDDDYATKLGMNGRKLAEENTWDKTIINYVNYYRQAISHE